MSGEGAWRLDDAHDPAYDDIMPADRIIAAITSDRDALKRFGVKSLTLFGSHARGEATEASDVDLIVSFEDRADFDRFFDLKSHLEVLVGAQVDLVTEKGLREELRARIAADSIRVA